MMIGAIRRRVVCSVRLYMLLSQMLVSLYLASFTCSQGLQDKKSIAKNIEAQARSARALFIWTDCDREGEHIGSEVRAAALKGNRRIEVKRAKFSNIERA
jgi:DNA topoisomerase IA